MSIKGNTCIGDETHSCDSKTVCTVKKRLAIFLSPAGMSLTKLSLAGKNLIFPARVSLESNIPGEDGKIDNLFYSAVFYSYSRSTNVQSLAMRL